MGFFLFFLFLLLSAAVIGCCCLLCTAAGARALPTSCEHFLRRCYIIISKQQKTKHGCVCAKAAAAFFLGVSLFVFISLRNTTQTPLLRFFYSLCEKTREEGKGKSRKI